MSEKPLPSWGRFFYFLLSLLPLVKLQAGSPIGIFDSGIGGLTVAHRIHQHLPNEQIVYFGDTAHLPYGDKSEAAIQAYSIKIADVLLKKGCKVIVIACNSASSASYELLKEYVRHQVHIINVIDPMVEYVASTLGGRKIGLIGTKRTVQSGIYSRKLHELNPTIELKSLATPLLAPMIEEGFYNSGISHEIIAQYLSDPALSTIEALILACTHYPLIEKEIKEYYKDKVTPIDSSVIVAEALEAYLMENDLISSIANPVHHFLVSDYTESFEAATQIFFGEKVKLEWHPLWN
jgi:glutamate racemase